MKTCRNNLGNLGKNFNKYKMKKVERHPWTVNEFQMA